MPPVGFLYALSRIVAFFRRNFQPYRKTEVQNAKSLVFYRRNRAPVPDPPENADSIEDSQTSGAGARDLGDFSRGAPVKYVIF